MTRIPDSLPDDLVGATFAYTAGTGLYMVPIKNGTKNPGSILGRGWPTRSTDDPQVLEGYLTGKDNGIALHCDRSGVLVFDVDRPDQLPPELAEVLSDPAVPFQSTRDNDPRRGHYVLLMPAGRKIGNTAFPWGELRGRNGVIVLGPTEHEKAAEGGRYLWKRTGPVPAMPGWLADQLPDSKTTDGDTLSNAEVRAWIEAHPGGRPGQRPGKFRVGPLAVYRKRVQGLDSRKYSDRLKAVGPTEKRQSRHVALTAAMIFAVKEINRGDYGADVLDQLHTAHRAALADETHPNGAQPGRKDFPGVLAWCIAQAANDPAVDGLNPAPAEVPQRSSRAADVDTGSRDTVSPRVPTTPTTVTTPPVPEWPKTDLDLAAGFPPAEKVLAFRAKAAAANAKTATTTTDRKQARVTSTETAKVIPIRQNRTGMPDRATMAGFEWFWDALPENRVIADYARTWRLSPWAVYLSTLARFSLTVPPSVVGIGVVTGPSPLNLFAWITGESGTGKGGAMAAAGRLLDLGEPVDPDPHAVIGSVTPGSGEGISHLFKRWPTVTKAERALIDKGEMAAPGLEQYRRAVHLLVPEITRLESLTSRPGGSHLLTECCQIWSGELAGTDGYVDKSKCIPIDPHSARLSMTAGCQPSQMGQGDGKSWWERLRRFGFTQRGVYAPATDPLAPEHVPSEKPYGAVLRLSSPAPHLWTKGSLLTMVPVSDAVATELDTWRVGVLRGDVDTPLELSHLRQNKLRVACLMHLLHDRLNGQQSKDGVTDRYWELAGAVMEVSEATRLAVVDLHRDQRIASVEQEGRMQGIREIATGDTVHAEGVQRASRWVLGYLERKGPTGRASLRKACDGGRVGKYLADAVGKLLETGQITVEKTDRGEQYART